MVRIYNETRVVFNPAWSSDGNPNAVQTKLRHFEVPGCGAFQITNENSELAELFKRDEEVVFYTTDEDLLEKVEKYVADDVSRNAIAAAGHQRALSEHSLDHRVSSLFQHACSVFPPSAQPNAMPARVKTINVQDAAALIQLRNDMGNNPALFEDADWIHLIGGEFYSIKTDYAVLEPFFRGCPEQILAVSTFFDFTGLASNPLQPKLMESNGCLLVEDVDVKSFDLPLLDTQGGSFLGVSLEEYACLLVNYIAPRSRVAALIDAFMSRTVDAVHQLHAVPTGRIVTELLLTVPDGYEFSTLGVRNAEYVKRLRHFFPRFVAMNQRVVIYGISGMGEAALKLAEQTPGLNLVGVVDRSLNVASFQGIPVLKPEQLQEVRPDVVVLTSGSSGPSIYASIAHLEAIMCILPLYDLNHPVWSVVN
jgi:hypothetical protein